MGTLDNTAKSGVGRPFEEACGTMWDTIEANLGGTPADGSITNAKLATDVKVGSLASLTTTATSDVVSALNELDGEIGDLATLTTTATSDLVSAINELDGDIGDLSTLTTTAKGSSVAAINELDGDIGDLSTLTTTAKGSAVAAINELDSDIGTPLQADASTDVVRRGTVAQNGSGQTNVVFQSSTSATKTSSNAETYDLTGVGDGGTIIVNVDAAGASTATVNFAQGNSISDASPSTDISGETDNKFNIAVNGGSAQEVALTIAAGLNSGANIATEMQSKIQALGGDFASVTVDYNVTAAGKYAIISGQYGTGSAVVITPASTDNITEELKIGTADGGTENAGTGDVVDAAAATAAEIATVINTDVAGQTSSGATGSIVVTSSTTGASSSLVWGNGTLNAVLGFTNTEENYGSEGLGYAADMANNTYTVILTINGVAAASLATKDLGVSNKAASNFMIECEDTTSTDNVDVVVFGLTA